MHVTEGIFNVSNVHIYTDVALAFMVVFSVAMCLEDIFCMFQSAYCFGVVVSLASTTVASAHWEPVAASVLLQQNCAADGACVTCKSLTSKRKKCQTQLHFFFKRGDTKLSWRTDAQRMQCAVRKLYTAFLPVVSLPVPEQQVSEPVPWGQREHLLLQFDHGHLLKTQRQRQKPPQTEAPHGGGGRLQNQLRSSSFCYSKLTPDSSIRLMAPRLTSFS